MVYGEEWNTSFPFTAERENAICHDPNAEKNGSSGLEIKSAMFAVPEDCALMVISLGSSGSAETEASFTVHS
jgi:hypothetical protein